MPEFLKLLSVDDARELFWKNLPQFHPSTELINIIEALSRILGLDIISSEFLPAFTRSSMDGYAVKAQDTHGASESLPAYLQVVGEIPMGKETNLNLKPGEAALIHTGGMLPQGGDAVVMMENTQNTGTGQIEVIKPVSKDENLLLKGEDVKPGDVILNLGKKIRPEEIGGLLALGLTRVEVFKMPKVGILSSGDEVIPPDEIPEPGQVRDINSMALAALTKVSGGEPSLYPIVKDEPRSLERAIHKAYQENDLVIVTAGSSASTRDLTAEAISKMGKPGVLVHGINIRPGKPTILAVCDGKPMVGLPGNPISALVIARLFVQPLIEKMTGRTDTEPVCLITAFLSNNLPSQAGKDEFIPAKIAQDGNKWIANPIFFKSNLIFTLVQANGLIHIPADVTGYSAGDLVKVIRI